MKRVFAFISLFAIALVMFGFGTNVQAADQPAEGKFFENPYLLKDEDGNVVEIPMYIMDSIYSTFPDYFDYEGAKGTEFEDKNWGGIARQYAWNGVKLVMTQFDENGATGKSYAAYQQGGNKGGEVGIGAQVFTTSGTYDKGAYYNGGAYARTNAPDMSLSFYLKNDKAEPFSVKTLTTSQSGSNDNKRYLYLVFDAEGKAVAGLMLPDTSANAMDAGYGLGEEFCYDKNGVGIVAGDGANCSKVMVDGTEDDLTKPILDEEGNETGEYEKIQVEGDAINYITYRYVWEYMEEAPANLNNSYLGEGWKADNWDFYNAETGIAVCFLGSSYANAGNVNAAELAADPSIETGHCRAPFNTVSIPAGGLYYQLGYLERNSTLLPTYKEVQAQAYLYGREEAYSGKQVCVNYASSDLAFIPQEQGDNALVKLAGTNTIEVMAGATIDFSALINLTGVSYAFADLNDPTSFQSSLMGATELAAKKAQMIEAEKAVLRTELAYTKFLEWKAAQEATKAAPLAEVANAEAALALAEADLAKLLAEAEVKVKEDDAYKNAAAAVATAQDNINKQKNVVTLAEAALEVAEAKLAAANSAIEETLQYKGYIIALNDAQEQYDTIKATKDSYEALGMDAMAQFKAQYDTIVAEFNTASTNLDTAKTALAAYKAECEAQNAGLEVAVTTAKADLTAAKTTLGAAATETAAATGLYAVLELKETALAEIIESKAATMTGYADKVAAVATAKAAVEAKKAAVKAIDDAIASAEVAIEASITATATVRGTAKYDEWLLTGYLDDVCLDYTVVEDGLKVVYRAPYATKAALTEAYLADWAKYAEANGVAKVGGEWGLASMMPGINGNGFYADANFKATWGWILEYINNQCTSAGNSGAMAKAYAGAASGWYNYARATCEIIAFLTDNTYNDWRLTLPADVQSAISAYNYMGVDGTNYKSIANGGTAETEAKANGWAPTTFEAYEFVAAPQVNGKKTVVTTIYNPILDKTYSMTLNFISIANEGDYTPTIEVNSAALIVSDVATFDIRSIAKAYDGVYNGTLKGNDISEKIVYEAQDLEAAIANGKASGSYVVKMSVTNNNGNKTIVKYATVKINDSVAPVLQARDVVLPYGSDFYFLDGIVFAYDNAQGNLFEADYFAFSLDSKDVNTYEAGDYTVKVSAMDKSGNSTTVEYVVTVNEKEVEASDILDAIEKVDTAVEDNSKVTDAIKTGTDEIKNTTAGTAQVAEDTQVAAEDNGLVVIATVLAGVAAVASVGAVVLVILKRK